MTRAIALLCLVTLAACGADGEPQAPGITLGGTASAGVVVK